MRSMLSAPLTRRQPFFVVAEQIEHEVGPERLATFDLYGHLLPGSEDEAEARLDTYFSQNRSPDVAHTVAHPVKIAV